jgi:hypothetical protein
MTLKLPKLTWELDCEPLGYPGLVIEMVLNPPIVDFVRPEKAQPWETEYYVGLSRIIDEVLVPARYTSEGQAVTIVITGPEDVWVLEHDPGFDPQLLLWVMNRYTNQRQERLRAERKN